MFKSWEINNADTFIYSHYFLAQSPTFFLVKKASASENVPNESYLNLAKTTTTDFYLKLVPVMDSINKNTLPHDLKCFRKDIGKMKTLVDIFIYAYGAKSGNDDPISLLRDFLDYGYETLGHFKDEMDKSPENAAVIKQFKTSKCTYDVPPDVINEVYNKKKVKKKLNAVIDWTNEAKENQNIILGILEKTKKRRIEIRNKAKLSKFYWGSTNFTPDLSLSGLKNIQYLQLSILQKSIIDLDQLLTLRRSHNEKYEELFHDFRKHIRSVVRIDEFFPQTRNPQLETDIAFRTLKKVVGKFGDINDLLSPFMKKN